MKEGARRGQGGGKEGARRGQGGGKEGARRGQGGGKEGLSPILIEGKVSRSSSDLENFKRSNSEGLSLRNIESQQELIL